MCSFFFLSSAQISIVVVLCWMSCFEMKCFDFNGDKWPKRILVSLVSELTKEMHSICFEYFLFGWCSAIKMRPPTKYYNGVVICIWTGFNMIFSQRLSHPSWVHSHSIDRLFGIGKLVSLNNTWTKCKTFIISSYKRTWHHDVYSHFVASFSIHCDFNY